MYFSFMSYIACIGSDNDRLKKIKTSGFIKHKLSFVEYFLHNYK
jgi:hypothetical protein